VCCWALLWVAGYITEAQKTGSGDIEARQQTLARTVVRVPQAGVCFLPLLAQFRISVKFDFLVSLSDSYLLLPLDIIHADAFRFPQLTIYTHPLSIATAPSGHPPSDKQLRPTSKLHH